jgi:hypothetical protein
MVITTDINPLTGPAKKANKIPMIKKKNPVMAANLPENIPWGRGFSG